MTSCARVLSNLEEKNCQGIGQLEITVHTVQNVLCAQKDTLALTRPRAENLYIKLFHSERTSFPVVPRSLENAFFQDSTNYPRS
jgi:hypothetical protein